MTDTEIDNALTIAEAAALAGKSVRTIDRAISLGHLQANWDEGSRRIDRTEIERYIRTRAPEPIEDDPGEKDWSIRIGSTSRSSRCVCGNDASAFRDSAFRVFFKGGLACSACAAKAPADVAQFATMLAGVSPAEGDRNWSIAHRQSGSNHLSAHSGKPVASGGYAWGVGSASTETKLLNIADAEDACPTLAQVIHKVRGTSPAVRIAPTPPVARDPLEVERERLRVDRVARLAVILGPPATHAQSLDRAAALLSLFEEISK